jgi:hypothetical protein
MNGATYSETTVPSVVSSHTNEHMGPGNVIFQLFLAVLRIRIRRIRMFLGLLNSDPAPLVRDTDPAPLSSKKSKKNPPYFLLFCDFSFDFLSLKNDVHLASKSYKRSLMLFS